MKFQLLYDLHMAYHHIHTAFFTAWKFQTLTSLTSIFHCLGKKKKKCLSPNSCHWTSQCCYVWARTIFQSGATSENYTLNLSAFTGGSTVQHIHTHTLEWRKKLFKRRTDPSRDFVIIKCFGVSRVERPLIDISWNKDQPHLLCHSLRWRGKYSWPFFALDAIFPLFTPDSP